MTTNTLWSITLVLGLVVIVVAVVLLQLFLRQVHRVERGAAAVWKAGKEVARNTATTWLLDGTSEGLDALAAEAQRHDELLRGSAPKVGG